MIRRAPSLDMPDFLIDNGARWSASSGCTLETHERDASQSSPQYSD
jgi:hypothetical protein